MIGHETIRAALETSRPRVSLFVGPPSVGKWTLAEHLSTVWGVEDGRVIRIQSPNIETARSIASLSYTAGPKMIIIRLDGASPAFQNALLKTIEETPHHFILVSAELPLSTVVSRCEVYQFSMLSDAHVKEILQGRNFGPERAQLLASVSGGQVRNALAAIDDQDTKLLVLSAMRAVVERDGDALDTLSAKWTDVHTSRLSVLCTESITGRWRVFSEAEAQGCGKKVPLRILRALRADIRPRLVVRASLMEVLRSTQ